jgi:hypothetical protein
VAVKDTASKALMIKIVYFDEQSASDYLDISAGGKAASTSEDVRKRAAEMATKAEAKAAAKFKWLPFLGASAELGGNIGASRASQSILSKTLSNTILTDYMEKASGDNRIVTLKGFRVAAAPESMAYMKMYTPFMIIAKTEESGVDLAKLDEAFEKAKGYYELVGSNQQDGARVVLRFNIAAFRNNYGLTDLARMTLVYHGIHVGHVAEGQLSMSAEMSSEADGSKPPTALEVLDGPITPDELRLKVYDVILAGVEILDEA